MMPTSMEYVMKALVVDEDLICLNVASKLFQKFNFKGIVPFQSAAEALYSLKESKDDEYDVALIEVHVGYTGFASMTGFDLLDHIQKEKKIPVFTMCAHKEDDKLLVQGLRDKVASFHISKPLTAERVQIIHQKVMEAKAKSSVEEASGINDLLSNEIYASENLVVHVGSDVVEENDGRDQRKKRVHEDSELHASKNLCVETSKEGSAAEDIIRKIVYQGQSNNQTFRHLQEDQQAEKNNGMISFQGSKSNQSALSYFQPIPQYQNLDFNKNTSSPPHATTTSGPFLSGLLNGSNTAPRHVVPNSLYPFVGLCMHSNGNLLSLQWKNIGHANWMHFGEGSGSLNQTSIDATTGNTITGSMRGPGGDNLAALNWNKIEYRVASGNLIPDALHGNNSGSYVPEFSVNEPGETAVTDLLDVVEDFDIDKFNFDGNFID